MIKILLVVCVVRSICGIIVKDTVVPEEEYKYWYEIEDLRTGDNKRVREMRRGGLVTGAYSVLDPDGTRRTVHYTADPSTGFKAVLVQEPDSVPADLYAASSLEHFYGQAVSPGYQRTTQYMVPYLAPLSRCYFKRNKYFTPAAELMPTQTPIHKKYFEPNKNK